LPDVKPEREGEDFMMTHQPYEDRRMAPRLTDIVAADEANPSIGRQIMNGITGVMVLMLTGVLIVLLVLWKSP
jgi:hypothetical protein